MKPGAEAATRAPVAWTVATFFGVGHFPVASGTVATAAALPVYLLCWAAGGSAAVAAAAVALSLAGVAAATVMETRLGYHDPSEVVIDEVAGFMVTMLYIEPTLWTCAAGFLLFRAFDILKPWPASRAEKLPGGWGIMSDDLICGLMANAVIRLGMFLWA